MTSSARDIIIIGAGGHAKSVTQIAKSLNYNVLGYLDDFSTQTNVLGKIQDISLFKNVQMAIGIGGIKNLSFRNKLLQSLKDYYPRFLNLIAPSAILGNEIQIGIGNTIHPFVFINNNTRIGNFCIINTRATIEHDCQIGDNVHISTGAILNGEVKIGNHVFVGSGTLIKNNVQIHDNVVIGLGSVVLYDIHEPGIYAGNPLKQIQNKIIYEPNQ